jgi:hypothetical protein
MKNVENNLRERERKMKQDNIANNLPEFKKKEVVKTVDAVGSANRDIYDKEELIKQYNELRKELASLRTEKKQILKVQKTYHDINNKTQNNVSTN